jgi:hypothetical protein
MHIIKITPSPNKENLIEYGGTMSHDDYNKEIIKCNNEQTLSKYKLEHYKNDIL